MKTVKKKATKKPELDSAAARDRIMAWLAETFAVLESITATAEMLAAEVKREDSSFYGAVRADKLSYFSGQLGDVATDITNNWPAPAARLMNPLAGLEA